MAGPEIEFLDDAPDPAPDEELSDDRPPHRRGLMITVLAAVVLLTVALIARGLASTGSAHRAGPRPASSGAPVPSAAGPTFSVQPDTGRLSALSAGAAGCPAAGDGGSVCDLSARVPVAVTAAFRAHFPHVGAVSGVTARVRDTGFGPGGIWYRELHAKVGAVGLVVTVARRQVTDRNQTTAARSAAAVTYERSHVFPGFTVTVRATVAAGDEPGTMPGEVRGLADDHRLGTL